MVLKCPRVQTPAGSGSSCGPLEGWWGWCGVCVPLPSLQSEEVRRECCSPLHPPCTHPLPFTKTSGTLVPHDLCAASAVLWPQPSIVSGPGRGTSFSPRTRISSCFQIHISFPGEINQCPLTTSFLQTQGACLRWGLHFWLAFAHCTLGYGLWEQPRENWLCLKFHVSGRDAAFKH